MPYSRSVANNSDAEKAFNQNLTPSSKLNINESSVTTKENNLSYSYGRVPISFCFDVPIIEFNEKSLRLTISGSSKNTKYPKKILTQSLELLNSNYFDNWKSTKTTILKKLLINRSIIKKIMAKVGKTKTTEVRFIDCCIRDGALIGIFKPLPRITKASFDNVSVNTDEVVKFLKEIPCYLEFLDKIYTKVQNSHYFETIYSDDMRKLKEIEVCTFSTKYLKNNPNYSYGKTYFKMPLSKKLISSDLKKKTNYKSQILSEIENIKNRISHIYLTENSKSLHLVKSIILLDTEELCLRGYNSIGKFLTAISSISKHLKLRKLTIASLENEKVDISKLGILDKLKNLEYLVLDKNNIGNFVGVVQNISNIKHLKLITYFDSNMSEYYYDKTNKKWKVLFQ